MTYWMNDEVENRRAVQNLIDPLAPAQIEETPGAFKGALAAPFVGIKEGVDQLAVAVGDATIPYLQDAAEPLFGDDAVAWLEDQRIRAHDIARRNRIDPATTGFVGQTLHGAASVITQATIGTLATGTPMGGAVAAGGGTGYAEYNQLVEQGVDPETAKRIASITAVDTGVGVLLPMTIGGGLAGAAAWGASTNVALGAAGRYDSGRVLEEGGYTEMAEHYKVLDSTAIATDLLMGAGFPLAGRGVEKVKAHFAKGEEARGKLTPEQLDAADVAARVVHEERDLSPGLHKTPESMNAHLEALRAVEDAVADGKDPGDVNIGPIVARMDMAPDGAQAQAALEARAAVEAEIPAEVKLEAERTRAEAETPVAGTEVGSITNPLPASAKDTAPVGAWVASDIPDLRGTPVMQVREMRVDELYLPELTEDGRLQPEKQKYLEGYAERAKAGERPPNLYAVEMEDGRVRVVDGHRRAMAAKAAGQETVRVLVSPLADSPDGDGLRVTLTREMAAKAPPEQVPTVDPSDTAAVAKAGDIGTLEQAAVNQALDAMPDLRVPDPDRPGETIPARELLARLDKEIETAKQDGSLAQVAAACFMAFGD